MTLLAIFKDTRRKRTTRAFTHRCIFVCNMRFDKYSLKAKEERIKRSAALAEALKLIVSNPDGSSEGDKKTSPAVGSLEATSAAVGNSEADKKSLPAPAPPAIDPEKTNEKAEEKQTQAGWLPATWNTLLMFIRIFWLALSTAWKKDCIIPFLFFLWTVVRYPFVSLAWSGVYLTVTVASLVLACSERARTAVMGGLGTVWEVIKKAAVSAYNSGFVCAACKMTYDAVMSAHKSGFIWVLPLACMVGTVVCFVVTGWWSLTLACFAVTFHCFMCCYSEDTRNISWKLWKESRVCAFTVSANDVWATVEKSYNKWILLAAVWDMGHYIFTTAFWTFGVACIAFSVRISFVSKLYAQVFLIMLFCFLAWGIYEQTPDEKQTPDKKHNNRREKRPQVNAKVNYGRFLKYVTLCAVMLFNIIYVPDDMSPLNMPTMNDLRAADLMKLLWNAGFVIWTPFLRIDQLVRCNQKWESDWCKQVIAIAAEENKVFRKIGWAHLKNEDLYSRYYSVDFVFNATKRTTDNVSIGEVTGVDTWGMSPFVKNSPILEHNAMDYMLMDVYNRTQNMAHVNKSTRDWNLCVDQLWVTKGVVFNHAVKQASIWADDSDTAKKISIYDYLTDIMFLFNKIQYDIPVEDKDSLLFDHTFARNVCTHMHPCVNGTPMVEKDTTTVKPRMCKVPKPAPCACASQTDNVNKTDNANKTEGNATNKTAEEPSAEYVEGTLEPDNAVISEKNAEADATGDTHIATKTVKICVVLGIIFIVAGAMAMEKFIIPCTNVVYSRAPTPVRSRVASRTASRVGSRVGSRSGSPSRNPGMPAPIDGLVSGVCAILGVIPEAE